MRIGRLHNQVNFRLDFFRSAVALALSCLLHTSLAGQDYPLREYGVVDGLPQSQIYSITQDSRGFLWIVTKNGLSRFDGIDFVNYGRKDGLPSNILITVVEDGEGRIWALSNEGLSEYTGTSFVFNPPPPEYDSMLFINAVPLKGSIMLNCTRSRGMPGTMLLFRNGTYSPVKDEYPGIRQLKINKMDYDRSSNSLLILENSGIVYLLQDAGFYRADGQDYTDLQHNGDRAWVKKNDDFYKPVEKGLEKDTSVFSGEGLHVTFSESDRVNRIVRNDGAYHERIDLPFSVTGYFTDRENVLWIATESNMFRLAGMAFSSFSERETGSTNIWSLASDDKGHVWLGSLSGSLKEYDGTRFIEHGDHLRLFRSVPSFYKGSRQMTDGSVWFATNMGIIKRDGRKFSRVREIPETAQVCIIYEDPLDGSVFAGTDLGLYRIKDNRSSFFSLEEYPGMGVVEGVTRLDDGSYLLSGHLGLSILDRDKVAPVDDKLLPEGSTFTLVKDPVGGAWITSEEGLFLRDHPGGAFRPGLPAGINGPANSIILMDSTHIMVGRGSDICIIDLARFYSGETSYFRIYDKSDGFEGSDCIDNGIARDSNGKYWILTANRLVRFDPVLMKVNRQPPILHITSIYYQDDSLLWKPASSGDLYYGIPRQLLIPSGSRKVRISFTGISTTNPEKVKYAYRLRGLSDGWSDPSAERSVVYESLSPGYYTFELRAANADGFESPLPLMLSFKVMPTLWQTLVFRLFLLVFSIILVVVLTYLYFTRMQNRLKSAERLRKELANLQMSSVVKQFDPHFTFNVINSVGALIMEGQRDAAYDYITKLSSLLRRAFMEGALVVRSLSDEIDFVSQYCELQKLRFNERFSYSIEVGSSVDTGRPLPRMLIQIFVENAVKHGFGERPEGGRVDVEILNENEVLLIFIRDNGVGRSEASSRTTPDQGSGIMLVSSILRIMNERNSLRSGLEIRDLINEGGPAGTEVRIWIPDGYEFSFS